MLARFKSLPAKEFNATLVEELSTLAWGCWYAATENEKSRATSTEAKLPAELVQKAVATESRMQACCEYYLNDHPDVGPQLAALRAGSGHQDLAADLLGYANIYREHWDVLSADKKHFQAADADDAVKIAEDIITHLGAKLSPEARQTADFLARAWTLLIDSYEEIAITGRWLLRHDPRASQTLPSLFTLSRSRRQRAKTKSDPASTSAEG